MKDSDAIRELEASIPFQRDQWVWQRTVWVVLVALVIAGMAGLAGSGPVASRTSHVEEGWQLQSPRFARLDARARVELTRDRPHEPALLVRLDGDYAESFVMEHTRPLPVTARRQAGVLTLEFAPGTSRVTLLGRPSSIGLWRGGVRLGDGERAPLWTWVQP